MCSGFSTVALYSDIPVSLRNHCMLGLTTSTQSTSSFPRQKGVPLTRTTCASIQPTKWESPSWHNGNGVELNTDVPRQSRHLYCSPGRASRTKHLLTTQALLQCEPQWNKARHHTTHVSVHSVDYGKVVHVLQIDRDLHYAKQPAPCCIQHCREIAYG